MLESALQRKIKDYATTQGWLVRKLETPAHIGAPDLLLIRDGEVLFIEVKQKGKKPRPSQLAEHAKYRAHGATVLVADELENNLKKVLQTKLA